MSHLSILIHRVEAESKHEFSPLFEQAVINLMEYLILWDNHTQDEKKKAMVLYDTHRPKCTGKGMPSHGKRLKKADEIRKSLK